MSMDIQNDSLSFFQKTIKVLYDSLGIENFKKFFNHFGTLIIVLILCLTVLAAVLNAINNGSANSNDMTAVGIALFFVSMWILLFVSTALKEIVVEELKQDFEKDVFITLEKLEKKTQILEKKLDKILDIIYEEESPLPGSTENPLFQKFLTI